jgi:hypothetical protein
MESLARTLERYEAGELQDSTELLRAYAGFILPFIDGSAVIDMNARLRRFIEAGDAVYRENLGSESPPPRYNLALRMLGLGVLTRSRARRQAEVSQDTPGDPGPEGEDTRPSLNPPRMQAEVTLDATPERGGEQRGTRTPSPPPSPPPQPPPTSHRR